LNLIRLNLDGTGLQKHRQAKCHNDSACNLADQKDIEGGNVLKTYCVGHA